MEELAKLVQKHQSVLIFCNTRSGAETIGIRLKQVLPELASRIETHHSSLDRSVRPSVAHRPKPRPHPPPPCPTRLQTPLHHAPIALATLPSPPKLLSRTRQRIRR